MPREGKPARSSSHSETAANLGLEAKLWQAASALRNNPDLEAVQIEARQDRTGNQWL